MLELNFLGTCISMTGKKEKVRRKEVLHSLREEKRRRVREGLPVPASMMKALFDYIDEQLSFSKCDHSLRHASEFTKANRLPKEAIIAWLERAGSAIAKQLTLQRSC